VGAEVKGEKEGAKVSFPDKDKNARLQFMLDLRQFFSD
jgi:hypothetical protein